MALRQLFVKHSAQSEDRFELLTAYCRSRYGVEIAVVVTVPDATPGVAAACSDPDVLKGLKSLHVCQHSCALPLDNDRIQVIKDARLEPDLADCAISTNSPYMRFYVGAPITGKSGGRRGTICLVDRHPRSSIDEEEIAHLGELAACVAQEMENGQAA